MQHLILKYRLAIFDSDGTLADTLPWMRSIFNELAEEHGFRRLAPDDFQRMRDLHGGALLRELGFNRLSFGVQDFDPQVQRAVHRIQDERETSDAIAQARARHLRR